MNWRPESVAEIARRTTDGEDRFDAAVREFLDSWQSLTPSERADALRDEPRRIRYIEDAYLGALAEHLASQDRLPVPEWTEAAYRFLREPFFAGGLESLKAILLVESPPAFRRRLIFISADGLSRPRRVFVNDDAAAG